MRPGERLGPYHLRKPLGSGGMGVVFEAEVAEDCAAGLRGRKVALKVIHPERLAAPDAVERFRREAEAGLRVDHDCVVRTLDVGLVKGEADPVHYLAMEFVEGSTLRQLMAESGRQPEPLCRHIGHEVARGLAAVHDAGILHRDLKPENVLITQDQQVKIADFGVALLGDLEEEARLTRADGFPGSLLYAAPEQVRRAGRRLDQRADLYSLGLLLYELGTGRHAFFGHPGAGRAADVKRPEGDRLLFDRPSLHGTETLVLPGAASPEPSLSAFFEEVVRRLLARDPARRFPSAAELRAVLYDGERSSWWSARLAEMRARAGRPPPRLPVSREVALAGRDRELLSLETEFSRARAGDGRVVILTGEAGVGKSRLLDHWIQRAHDAGREFQFLFGSNEPRTAGSGAAVALAFRSALAPGPGETWQQQLENHLEGSPALVDLLTEAIGEGSGLEHGGLSLDSLKTALVRVLKSLAGHTPIVLLVEDLHFASEVERSLFAALAAAVAGQRVLLLGTARPEVSRDWLQQIGGLPQCTALPVERLTGADLDGFMLQVLGEGRVAQELGNALAEKSEGNPYFFFEMLKASGLLIPGTGGRWTWTGESKTLSVPRSLEDLMRGRLERLDPAFRGLLALAACLGHEFDPRPLSLADGRPRIAVLRELARIGRESGLIRAQGPRFRFDHHLVQEVLYGSQEAGARRDAHGRLAGALESAPLREQEPYSIASHFAKAGRIPDALRWIDSALEELGGRYDHEGAVDLLDRVLRFEGMEPRRRATLLLHKVETLRATGQVTGTDAVLREFEESASGLGDPDLEFQVWRQWGDHHTKSLDETRAEAAFRNGLAVAERTGDLEQRVRAVGNLVRHKMNTGHYREALEMAEAGVRLSRDLGDPDLMARSLTNLGILSHDRGDAEALDTILEAVELAQASGLELLHAKLRTHTANIYLDRSEFQSAFDEFSIMHSLARKVGDREVESQALAGLSMAAIGLGRLSESRGYLVEAAAVSQEGGNNSEVIHTGIDLAEADLLRGRPEQGLRLLDRLRPSRPWHRRVRHSVRARILEALGRGADALEEYAQARAVLGTTSITYGRVEDLVHSGRAHSRFGDRERGVCLMKEAIEAAGAYRDGAGQAWAASYLAAWKEMPVEQAESLYRACLGMPVLVRLEAALQLWHATGSIAYKREARESLAVLQRGLDSEDREPATAHQPVWHAVSALD